MKETLDLLREVQQYMYANGLTDTQSTDLQSKVVKHIKELSDNPKPHFNTTAKLYKGDEITGLVINYSIGGYFHGTPIQFTKQLRFAGNNEKGLPMWEEPYYIATGLRSFDSTNRKWRPYNDDNWVVIAILPDRAKVPETYKHMSKWYFNNMLKVEELIPEPEAPDEDICRNDD